MLESKNIANPDDKRSFEHGEVSLVNLTGFTVGRAGFRPGWRWSTDVKPLAGTGSCQLAHSSYVVSGREHAKASHDHEATSEQVLAELGVSPEGASPPAHVHAPLDDSFYILDGHMVIHCGDDVCRPPGHRHRRPRRHAGPHQGGTGPGARRPRHHQCRAADGTGRG